MLEQHCCCFGDQEELKCRVSEAWLGESICKLLAKGGNSGSAIVVKAVATSSHGLLFSGGEGGMGIGTL